MNTIKRDSRIELLRILSMVMVLVLHCLGWSGALEYLEGIKYWVYWWLEALCIVAVDIFVLINGYFMVQSKFKAQNVLKIAAGGVWLYSVIFSSVSLIVSGDSLTLNYLVKMIFPFTTKKFWFVNSYIALYLLSPFLNKTIRGLSKKQFSMLVIILITMFSVRVTFLPISWSQDPSGAMGILSFTTLYCMAAWIRLYYKKDGRIVKYLATYIALSLLLPISKKAVLAVGLGEGLSGKLYGYSSLFVYAEAVALFLVFLNMNPMNEKAGKYINAVAKHSFSVYIIHFAMLGVLFTDIIPVNRYIGNVGTGVAAVVFAVVIVYAFCTCVDVVKSVFDDRIHKKITGSKIMSKYIWLTEYWDSIVN